MMMFLTSIRVDGVDNATTIEVDWRSHESDEEGTELLVFSRSDTQRAMLVRDDLRQVMASHDPVDLPAMCVKAGGTWIRR